VLAHSGAVSGFLAYNAMIPASRSAVVLLANCEDSVVLRRLHTTLLNLLLPKTTETPAIAGPAATVAARELLGQLQAGRIDRSALGEEYSHFLDPAKARGAAERLRRYGKPTRVELERSYERGGMEVAWVRFTFRSGALKALMYRTPDGKVQEFLVFRE